MFYTYNVTYYTFVLSYKKPCCPAKGKECREEYSNMRYFIRIFVRTSNIYCTYVSFVGAVRD